MTTKPLFSRIIAQLLCFAIGWMTIVPAQAQGQPATQPLTESELLAANPQARVVHVTAEEYPRLAEQLQQQGFRQVGAAQPLQLAQSERYPSREQRLAEAETTSPARQEPASCDESVPSQETEASMQFSLDLSHGGGGGGDDAIVLYIIIGTVVLVVWSLYVFKYLYDVATGYQPCRWSELAFTSSAISTFTGQHAYFNGLAYRAGVQDGATEFGISAELGHSDITLIDNGVLHLDGLYWLIGPNLRWRLSSGRNPHFFQMQFMAGSTESAQMGLLAKADLGLHLGVTDNMTLGLSWGAINMNLRESQGIISNHEQYYYLYGISAGYRF